MTTRTFTIIKPNAVEKGYTGKILDMIIGGGFRIVAMKMVCLSKNDAERFYAVHRGRPFFRNLIVFMTSGPVIAAVIEKDNAVEDFRKLVGTTNPATAAEGTIRKLYADSLTRNSIHASDSEDNAREEWGHFFRDEEIMVATYGLPFDSDDMVDSKP